MENISSISKDKCTGCGMCLQICPVNAIKMVANKEGFLEPKINKNKCTNCGLCYKKCPAVNKINIKRLDKPIVYAAKTTDDKLLKNSSSGGIFSIIAKYVLTNQGTVYGCAFDSELKANHIKITKEEDLSKLRGSKYVQSDTKNTFKEVKKDLSLKKLVLYSGTPCQIAGLVKFLGKNYDNLILVDFVCHGVPSQKLFQKYIKYLEDKQKSKLIYYSFRNKEKTMWGNSIKMEFENGKKKYLPAALDPFYRSYIDGVISRECCYNCKYSSDKRYSDITLMDYWGIEKEHPDFFDANGVSAVMINTKNGQDVFDSIDKSCMEYIGSSIDKVKKRNIHLSAPVKKHPLREHVYDDIDKKDFELYIKDNLRFSFRTRDVVSYMLPVKVKLLLKKTKAFINKLGR